LYEQSDHAKVLKVQVKLGIEIVSVVLAKSCGTSQVTNESESVLGSVFCVDGDADA
jgi:hypothetical protein